jgi:hypothetical protein
MRDAEACLNRREMANKLPRKLVGTSARRGHLLSPKSSARANRPSQPVLLCRALNRQRVPPQVSTYQVLQVAVEL